MPDSLRVLIVEDSSDDAELVVLHLSQAGYDPDWTRVETAAAFTRALATGYGGERYDIVLADYRLPQFSGLEAMRLLTASGCDIPLILISGTLGEDLAVESIKQGVTDYLLKDRLARLGTAVQQALAANADRRARQAAEAALRASEALRQLTDQLELRVEERTAELNAANAALHHASQAKDAFLASMSHELRTPLAGMLGVVEALQQRIYGGLTDRQQQAIESMRTSGEHLLALINDILDVAKAEAGQLRPQLDTFAVSELCQASLSLVRGMAQRKQQRIELTVQPPELILEADIRRLKQLLVNLLSNAVKFTPEGGRIGLEVTGDRAAQVVRLAVWDTGMGIAPEDLPKLFRPFTQLDSDLAREYAGTGLGLALVRNLAELHGGSVEVASTLGAGSRFTVTLPWTPPAPERQPGAPPALAIPAAPGPAAPAPNLTPELTVAAITHPNPLILLADDNPLMVDVYRAYLEAAGCRTLTASRGSEAVALAEREHPTAILMDIQMPGMDGFAAIRRLRASANPGVAATPILALTALAMPGDRERCLEAGANDYLAKPVQLHALVAAINRLLAAP